VRYLYSGLLYLALPYIFLRLWWRSRRLPAYRARWSERLGFYPMRLEKCIWVHAVSMGEVIAAVPLIKALQASYPSMTVLVTTMTPTGSAQVKSVFKDSVAHVYIPYDLPDAVARFLRAFRPVVGIVMETELWPNMVDACYRRAIPTCLMNARLSEKSARGYERIAPLAREMLSHVTVIAAHGQQDADRFIALGAPKERMVVTGSIKFDIQVSSDVTANIPALRAQLGNDRFIWIAASTHEGEETMILAAHKLLRDNNPQALLILVPRHPDRFDAIAAMCEASFKTLRRSKAQPMSTDVAVYLGDTMGELLLMYGAADAAFVGGSLIPRGGHNLLEPAALSKPLLSGPHLFNFKEISELFFAADALTVVSDAGSLAAQVTQWMQQPAARVTSGERARQVVEANRGALSKQLAIIQQIIANP
jgi:3-deoxy-D-manno-octulosonic-acid transferase